jgi:myo-inositol 2-dehydrogenase/D-chiro-inositol 1-dehydrogenase
LIIQLEKEILTFLQLRVLVDRVESDPKTKLMVGFTRRFDESYQDAKAKIQAGSIGRPLVMRSAGCEKGDSSPFFKQYLKGSGGIFLDSVIHDIDLSLFLLGEDSMPKSVCATGVAAIHTELEKDGDADNAVGICEFWDGKFAFYFNSRNSALGYDNQSEVFGTAGKVSINLVPKRNRVELADSDGYVKVEPTPSWYDRYKDAFVTEVNAWVDAVLDDKPMPVPLRSSLTGLAIAKALQESLRTRKKIEFDGKSLEYKLSSRL